jgi:hypothetical protein
LRGLTKTLSNETHAPDNVAGVLIIALAAKTDHPLDTRVFRNLDRFAMTRLEEAENVGLQLLSLLDG